jgi:hypothetical protein
MPPRPGEVRVLIIASSPGSLSCVQPTACLYTKLEKLQNELEVPESWSVYDRCTIKTVVECF